MIQRWQMVKQKKKTFVSQRTRRTIKHWFLGTYVECNWTPFYGKRVYYQITKVVLPQLLYLLQDWGGLFSLNPSHCGGTAVLVLTCLLYIPVASGTSGRPAGGPSHSAPGKSPSSWPYEDTSSWRGEQSKWKSEMCKIKVAVFRYGRKSHS